LDAALDGSDLSTLPLNRLAYFVVIALFEQVIEHTCGYHETAACHL
jgi:hypothetical protein